MEYKDKAKVMEYIKAETKEQRLAGKILINGCCILKRRSF